jgi:hypothetical protein
MGNKICFFMNLKSLIITMMITTVKDTFVAQNIWKV